MSVSSKSSTNVLGRWNGVVCFEGGVGVIDRERLEAGGVSVERVGCWDFEDTSEGNRSSESTTAKGIDIEGAFSEGDGDAGGWCDRGDGIAGWYGGCCESSNTDGGTGRGGFSSLLSSSVSFSSSSELSSTAASTTCTVTAASCLIKPRTAARSACQSWRMMRTKTRRLTRGESLTPFGQIAFSGEEMDGRREGGREDLRAMDCPSRDDEVEADGVLGLTSAGDEYDLFRDHPPEEDEGWGTRKDLVEPDRLSLVLRSPSWSNGASSEVGVLGGVRGEAKTSNWRER